MKKHWFRPKSYGWGFFPISWQGWIFTLVMLGVVLLSARINGMFEVVVTEHQAARFILDVLFTIGVSSYFAEKKTDGDLRWRWGK